MAEERLTDDPLKKGLEDEFLDIELEGLPAEGSEEYDEDLVGLTPTELKAELRRRRDEAEKAEKERERLLKAAAQKRAAGEFSEAESLYAQSVLYGGGEESERGIWACRTKEYTSAECFGESPETSAELPAAYPAVRSEVLEKLGDSMRDELEKCQAAAIPLREKWNAGRDSRRDAFRANRNYYLVRFGVAFALFVLFGIGCAVAAMYIVRTKEMTAPILTGVFGVMALVSAGVAVFFSRGLFLGQKLVKDNERLSATEDGVRLAYLENRIASFSAALEEPASFIEESGEYEEEAEPGESGDGEA